MSTIRDLQARAHDQPASKGFHDYSPADRGAPMDSANPSPLSSPWTGTSDPPYERGVALRDQCEPGTLLRGRGFLGTVRVVSVDATTIWAKYDGGVAPWGLYDAGMDLFLAPETETTP